MQMALQRSRLQVTVPKNGDRFSRAEMSAVNGDDEEEIEDGVVAFVINPGLTKWGDAHGKKLDQRYDIVRALVQPDAPFGFFGGVSLV
jgi:hypothetical protein